MCSGKEPITTCGKPPGPTGNGMGLSTSASVRSGPLQPLALTSRETVWHMGLSVRNRRKRERAGRLPMLKCQGSKYTHDVGHGDLKSERAAHVIYENFNVV